MSDANSLEWAVVAGAAGAIGSRIVERLAGRGLGVVLVGRTPGSLESLAEHHPRTVVCPADIRDDASIHAIRQAIDGPVRIAVNAAAAPMGGAVLDVTPEAVLSAIDVKVNGTLRLVHAVRDQLVEDSRIVLLGGNLGYDPIPEAATAGVGNAALANLVRQLSRALGPNGVTCHVVAPGPVWTERLHALLREAAQSRGVAESEVVDEFRSRSPINHLVTVEEVVWAVDLLIAPEARALAGGTLLLDAGQRTSVP
ncbi:MAG TPA: SDR family oxidoreductase [Acidimicrobiia bacterium]|jgi:NAD(P)-dependent dehydrogenase (short-subunit alcohol dehydrogenase family)|nr:SDR family oxidoreductase [Acidimicrobiia bacterium]